MATATRQQPLTHLFGLPRIPYGQEKVDFITYSPTCHDCGAEVGELHELGCDVEECPKCHRQLITCDDRFEIWPERT
ncbi:MAG: hypothetical protein AB1760_00260 [Pseudomonadota bacterium]